MRSVILNRDTPFAARIAFRLPQSLYDKLEIWAEEEDRPLANLVYTLVKQAVTEHEREQHALALEKEMSR
jgi:predicted DNA-binding protein